MVKVYGHPYGISSLETTLTLRNPPLRPLKDLVPAAPLFTLKDPHVGVLGAAQNWNFPTN